MLVITCVLCWWIEYSLLSFKGRSPNCGQSTAVQGDATCICRGQAGDPCLEAFIDACSWGIKQCPYREILCPLWLHAHQHERCRASQYCIGVRGCSKSLVDSMCRKVEQSHQSQREPPVLIEESIQAVLLELHVT